MKKYYKGIFVVWFLWLFAGMVSAQSSVDPMQLPQLTQWVTDFSDTLSVNQLDELNAIAKNYETESSNQIVAVVFPNRNGNELIDIGMKIFTDNGIGKKDVNNGLLLVISSEEKKIRIIVWYGLEWVYPDLMASQLIENDIRPLVNSGDIAGAIKVFYERSKQIIWWEIPEGYTSSSDESLLYVFLFLWFLLWLILRLLYKKKKFFPLWIHHSHSQSFWLYIGWSILIVILTAILTQFVVYFIMWVVFGISWVWFGWRWWIWWGGWFGWGFGWGWFSWWWGWSWGGGAGD